MEQQTPETEAVRAVEQPSEAAGTSVASAGVEKRKLGQKPSRLKGTSAASTAQDDQEENDREIALLFSKIHAQQNAFWDAVHRVGTAGPKTRKHKNVIGEAAVKPPQKEGEEAVITPVGDTTKQPAEPATDGTSMVREFVSPARSVFRVREDDWIEASTQGFTDVSLCDAHGQHLEPDPDQPGTKTTLRVSSGQKYVQSLVPTVPVVIVTPTRTGRRR